MATLPATVKAEIVTLLGQFHGYEEVARIVWARHGVAVARFQVRTYDPTNMSFAAGERWRALFYKARAACLEDIDSIPIAHKAYRLNQLQMVLDQARASGNLVLALNTLAQAAKEVGGKYGNQRLISAEHLMVASEWHRMASLHTRGEPIAVSTEASHRYPFLKAAN